jgi:hypothetical protein
MCTPGVSLTHPHTHTPWCAADASVGCDGSVATTTDALPQLQLPALPPPAPRPGSRPLSPSQGPPDSSSAFSDGPDAVAAALSSDPLYEKIFPLAVGLYRADKLGSALHQWRGNMGDQVKSSIRDVVQQVLPILLPEGAAAAAAADGGASAAVAAAAAAAAGAGGSGPEGLVGAAMADSQLAEQLQVRRSKVCFVCGGGGEGGYGDGMCGVVGAAVR